MLIKANTLKGYHLETTDGEIGTAREFYFDDKYWTIRYLIAKTAGWLTGRKVLLSPYSVSDVDTVDQTVSLDLTKKQLEDSPSIDQDEPVSRQFEDSYYGYYGYPPYWVGENMWGYYPYLERNRSKWGGWDQGTPWDRHLRSTHEVTGYSILASDGEIGHVVDFIVDDETWTIRYLVVDTTGFWPGKMVLISPQWIDSVSWEAREVAVDLSRESIKNAPEYSDDALLTREYETSLYGYYDWDGYWVSDLVNA